MNTHFLKIMSKFYIPDKLNLVVIIAGTLVASFSAHDAYSAKHIKKAILPIEALNQAVALARTSLGQGHRRQAIQILDQARGVLKQKNDISMWLKRRDLFLEQFLSSDSFQTYANAKSFAVAQRWPECLKELESIKLGDQENLFVLRLIARCAWASKTLIQARKTLEVILDYLPKDIDASFGLVEISIEEKQFPAAISLLGSVEPKMSSDVERAITLKAKVLEQTGQSLEAIETLRQDQESHLDHIAVIYELGSLYSRVPGNDWLARKYLSLFLSRCKRVNLDDTKNTVLKSLVQKAQNEFETIDKRLKI